MSTWFAGLWPQMIDRPDHAVIGFAIFYFTGHIGCQKRSGLFDSGCDMKAFLNTNI